MLLEITSGISTDYGYYIFKTFCIIYIYEIFGYRYSKYKEWFVIKKLCFN